VAPCICQLSLLFSFSLLLLVRSLLCFVVHWQTGFGRVIERVRGLIPFISISKHSSVSETQGWSITSRASICLVVLDQYCLAVSIPLDRRNKSSTTSPRSYTLALRPDRFELGSIYLLPWNGNACLGNWNWNRSIAIALLMSSNWVSDLLHYWRAYIILCSSIIINNHLSVRPIICTWCFLSDSWLDHGWPRYSSSKGPQAICSGRIFTFQVWFDATSCAPLSLLDHAPLHAVLHSAPIQP